MTRCASYYSSYEDSKGDFVWLHFLASNMSAPRGARLRCAGAGAGMESIDWPGDVTTSP